MRSARWILVVGITMSMAMGATAGAGELQVRAVPKVIMDAAKARFKTAKFVGAAKETNEAGEVVYEVTLSEKRKNIDVTITPAGAIALIEKEIALKDLPRAASDTLELRYPKARYQMVEEIYTVEKGEEKLAYYEALLVDPRKQSWAVELGLDGTVRKIENKTGEVD